MAAAARAIVRGASDRVLRLPPPLLVFLWSRLLIWATAIYAGLRRGELMALKWEDVSTSVIRVERGWDVREGEIAPKSRAGVRTVPIAAELRRPRAE